MKRLLELGRYLLISSSIAVFSFSPVYGQIISEARIMGVPSEFYDDYIAPLKGKEQFQGTVRQSGHGGTYREIGRSIGNFVLRTDPDYKENLLKAVDSLYSEKNPIRESDVSKIKAKINAFFPEILDEIEGFSQAIEMETDDALRVFSQYGITRLAGCTVFAVGKEKTADGNTLVGRNYDWLPTFTDNHIISVSPDGGYRSIGFSELTVGRLDGMNEHGLFVAVTATSPKDTDPQGFFFPIIVRAILDKARNLDEAIGILKTVPQSDGTNYLIADKNGEAAVVEVSPDEEITIRRLRDSRSHFLATTNHYLNPGTRDKNGRILPNSIERLNIINRLCGSKRNIDESDIEDLLTRKRPDGVFMNNYESAFGTLYSGIYNIENGTWRVRIGDYENRFSIEDMNIPEDIREIRYENEAAFIPDYIAVTGHDPVEPNSFFFRYGLLFAATPVMGPAAEFTANYKFGLFATGKTYGPHISAGLYALASPAFARLGMKLSVNPIPLLSLEVMPFYFLGWKAYHLPQSSQDNGDVVTGLIGDNKSGYYIAPALIVNPIINFGSLVSIENEMIFYRFDEPVYDYGTSLLAAKDLIWSPALQVIIPYSRTFLWGLRFEANLETAHGRYNMQAGPMAVFPKIFADATLVVLPSLWIHQAEGNTWWNIIVALRGQF